MGEWDSDGHRRSSALSHFLTFPPAIHSASVPPSTNFMAKKCRPPASPTS
jgi:hypothetical protein